MVDEKLKILTIYKKKKTLTKEIINLGSSDHADYFLNIFIEEVKWRLLWLL